VNNKGQTVIYTLMLAAVVVLFVIGIAPTLKIFTENARAPTSDTAVGLDCANNSISDFDKASCTMVDINFPFVILSMLALAGVIIGAKVMFQ
jgi:hypothetical protein